MTWEHSESQRRRTRGSILRRRRTFSVNGAMLLLLALAAALGAVSACSSDPAPRAGKVRQALEGSVEVAVELPPVLDVADVALWASDGLRLGSRSTVAGPPGTLPAAVAMGSPGALVRSRAELGDLFSRGPVVLRSRANVNGSVFTESSVDRHRRARIGGSVVTDFVFDPPTVVSWTAEVPDEAVSRGDIRLSRRETLELEPGRYGAVRIQPHATLQLGAGDYFFESLRIQPNGVLSVAEAEDPVRLYVFGSVDIRGEAARGGTDGPGFLLVALGSEPIEVNGRLDAFFFAPSADLTVRRASGSRFLRRNVPTHRGAFFARSVRLDGKAEILHRPFRPEEILPPEPPEPPAEIDLVLEPLPDDRTRVNAVSGTAEDGASIPSVGDPGHEICDPGLKLTSELDGIEPTTRLEFRSTEEAAPRCVVLYAECDEDGSNRRTPSLEELNAMPSLDSTCRGDIEPAPCGGVDAESVEWDDELGLCETDADCLLLGKVCARVCRRADCTGSPDCIDVTCQEEVEQRCARPSPSCRAEPTEGPCVEVRECPEFAASGSSDPSDPNTMTGVEDSNVDDPPAATPEDPAEPVEPPGEYAGTRCSFAPDPVDVVVNPEPEAREINAGSDKWGLSIRPRMSHQASFNQARIGGDGTARIQADARLDIEVRIWSKPRPVVAIGGEIEFGTCKAEVSRTLRVLGNDVDPGFGDLTSPDHNEDCNELLGSRRRSYAALKDAMFRAKEAKEYAECLGELTSENETEWQRFCTESIGSFHELGEADDLKDFDFTIFCADPDDCCDAPEDWRTMLPSVWLEYYRHHRDRAAVTQGELNELKQAVADAVPAERLDFIRFSQRFSAFRVKFDYPIGPVSVVIEIELTGGWGLSGALEPRFSLAPRAELGAGATLMPRLDVTALAFAGVGLGPVSVGLGGELLLLDVQTPLTTGVVLRQTPDGDPREPFLADAPYAFEVPIPGAPAAFEPFGPTWYDWNAEWTYGAAARTETLSGQIDVQARVKLGFVKKTFRKKLADWRGFRTDYVFIGGLTGGSAERAELEPLGSNPEFGKFFEDVWFPDPDFLALNPITDGPAESCDPPDQSICTPPPR